MLFFSHIQQLSSSRDWAGMYPKEWLYPSSMSHSIPVVPITECFRVLHQAPTTLHLRTSCWPVFQPGQKCWEASAPKSNLQPVLDGMPPVSLPLGGTGENNPWWVLCTAAQKMPFIQFLPFCFWRPYTPTNAFWDHFPNILLTLKSLYEGQLLREPNQDNDKP